MDFEVRHNGNSVWDWLRFLIEELRGNWDPGIIWLETELDETGNKDLFQPNRTCGDAVPVWKGRSFGAYDPHGRDPAGHACAAEIAELLVRRWCSANSRWRPYAERARSILVQGVAILDGEAPPDIVARRDELFFGIDTDLWREELRCIEECLGVRRIPQQASARLL